MSTTCIAKIENNTETSLKIVIEPWATEFDLAPGSVAELVARSDLDSLAISREDIDNCVILWVDGRRAIYEYWCNGIRID